MQGCDNPWFLDIESGILTGTMTGRVVSLVESRRKRPGGGVAIQYTVTIPKALVDAMGWKRGDRLEIRVKGKGILELREAEE